jgi:DNA-binding response OmpR family regulator
MRGEAQRTILVVEDDTGLRRLYRSALTLEGYTVMEAADGMQALRLLDESTPDLVILDLGLPLIGGLVVQQEIAAHAHTRNIPVVIVTGSLMNLDHLDVPCVLRKPVEPDELLRAVETCLSNGAPGVGA